MKSVVQDESLASGFPTSPRLHRTSRRNDRGNSNFIHVIPAEAGIQLNVVTGDGMDNRRNIYNPLDEHQKNNLYKYEIIGIIATVFFIFVLLSLVSYSPYDNTMFYYAHNHRGFENWAGWLGAQTAALLFYFFGFAAYILLISLIGFIYLMMKPQKGKRIQSLR
jgi:hypothetical protein